MGICGYNARMGEGLRVLFDGMYEAIATKAQAAETDIRKILERELVEIPAINESLAQGVGTPLQMFLGLNGLALPHFRHVLTAAMQGAEDVTRESFMAEVERFIDVLQSGEEHNLALPPASGDEMAVRNRAQGLGKWILTHLDD